MLYYSAWEEIPYELNYDTVRYRIRLMDEQEPKVIFEGNAHRAPDENTITIYMNAICEPFLNSECNAEIMEGEYENGFNLENGINVFSIEIYDEEEYDWVMQESFCILNDWSYSYHYSGGLIDLMNPVNGHYAQGMPFIKSSISDDEFGYHIKVELDQEGLPWYNTPACGDYSLIYQNSRGGIEAFLIEGNVIKTTNQTHSTFLKSKGLNRRETNVYRNEINDTWVCTTGWLSDTESAKFANEIMLSTQVWLYNNINGQTIPVEITDSAVKTKTYQNEGKKLVNYTINLKAANYKYRTN